MLLFFIVGVLAAWAVARQVERRRPQGVRLFWALALVVAALVYLVFWFRDPRPDWLFLEGIGLVLYGSLAWAGWRLAPGWLLGGWVLHSCWDLLLHWNGAPGYVPQWYPPFCLGFDLTVAAYLFWNVRLLKYGRVSGGE